MISLLYNYDTVLQVQLGRRDHQVSLRIVSLIGWLGLGEFCENLSILLLVFVLSSLSCVMMGCTNIGVLSW